VLGIAYTLTVGLYGVLQGFINPLDTLAGMCWMQANTPSCDKHDQVECIRGEGYRTLRRIAGTGVTLMVWIVVIVSMVLIYCTVPRTEKRLRRYGHGTNSNLQLSHRQGGIQANFYIAAFMMSYIFLVLVQLVEAGKTGENRTLYFGLACPATFFGALHGFFNAIIFLLPIARQTFGSAGSSVGFCLFSED
jgi:hypothetical protein